MPWVGFVSTIPGFERAETVYLLDGAATVIGCNLYYTNKYDEILGNIRIQTVDLSLCLAKTHNLKAYGRLDVKVQALLTSKLIKLSNQLLVSDAL
jgi:hypothetical protein